MRVVLDQSHIKGPRSTRGLGRYTKEVILAIDSGGGNLQLIGPYDSTARLSEFVEFGRRSVGLALRSFDLYHSVGPFLAARTKNPIVTSILDCIPLDVATHRKTGIKTRIFYSFTTKSEAILTISTYSKSRIIELLDIDPNRIFVAPLPVSIPTLDAPTPHNLARPYFISMADFDSNDPRKRNEWLPSIALALKAKGFDFLIYGTDLKSKKVPEPLINVGKVSDLTLVKILSNAWYYISATAYEGQGMTQLEALACGTPVIAMNNTSIPEIVGTAGLLIEEIVSPQNAARGPHHSFDRGCKDFTSRILGVALNEELRNQLAVRTKTQANIFSRLHFQTIIADSYQYAVGSGAT